MVMRKKIKYDESNDDALTGELLKKAASLPEEELLSWAYLFLF